MGIIGVIGCCNDNGSPTSPAGPLDITGTYRYQVTTTPRSGDCSAVDPSLSGTMTFAKTPENTWQMTACTIDDQPICIPYWWTVTVDGRQLSLSLDVDSGGVHVTIVFSGVVTDPAHFTLSGQIMKEPGACQSDGTAELTRI
jgi:hypothetical protein